MVDIVINENLINHIDEYDAIIIATNCYQVMRNGFQYEVSKVFPYVLERNYETRYGDITKLGTITETSKNDGPKFILAFTTFGYNFKGNDADFFEYESFEKCLKMINILYKGKHLATTMVGCTEFDGNANEDMILDIINKEVRDFDLTIYDYKQKSHAQICLKDYFKSLKKRYAKNKEKIILGGKGVKKARSKFGNIKDIATCF